MTTCARACKQTDRKENLQNKKKSQGVFRKGRDMNGKLAWGKIGAGGRPGKRCVEEGGDVTGIAIGGWDRQVGGQETNKTKGGNARSTQTSVRKRLENDSTTA